MNPTEIVPDGVEWLQAAWGLALFLLPGLAAADRLADGPRRHLLAPVFAWTLLPIGAIVAHFLIGARMTPTSTALLAVLLAITFGRRRIMQAWGGLREIYQGARPSLPRFEVRIRVAWIAVAVSCIGAGVLATVPHFEGEGPSSDWDVPLATADRLLAGDLYPYPIHVDEYHHMSNAGQMIRTGLPARAGPYTPGATPAEGFNLFSDVRERGFQVGVAQLHLLTGLSLPAIFVLSVAPWVAYTGLLVWAGMPRAPGAVLAPTMTALVPTTVLFIGPAFFVPIGLGLAWVAATVWVVSGRLRLLATMLLVIGSFYIHLVAAAACIIVVIAGTWLRPLPRADRFALAAAALLPLLWLGPAVATELYGRATDTFALPLGRAVFGRLGLLAALAAGLGAIWAFRGGRTGRPYDAAVRTWAALAAVAFVGVVSAIETGRNSVGLYYRMAEVMFLALAPLAAVGAGWVLRRATLAIGERPKRRLVQAAGGAVLVVAMLAPAVHHSLDEPYYRIHDESSWAAAAVMARHAGPGDIFLSHPWQAPLFHVVSGAYPHTVLYPGSPPVRGDDWSRLDEHDAAWFHDRDVTLLVDPHGEPPSVPHEGLGSGVYRIVGP